PPPCQRHLSRRHHLLPPARRVHQGSRNLFGARRRLPQRDVPQPRAHRGGRAEARRRGADRQVPFGLSRKRRRGVTERVAERSHLSIGEVLSLLREEFPDVTISKIRFLESQGLLDPERTPSGYRKFYDDDVERLRWILRQQRENFLPLKVIKGRLSDHGGEEGVGPAGTDDGPELA